MTRSEWGAVPAKEVTPLNTYPPPFVVIHHSDGRNCTNSTKCKKIVAAIQAYHMHDRKWNDIGYNFLVSTHFMHFNPYKHFCFRLVVTVWSTKDGVFITRGRTVQNTTTAVWACVFWGLSKNHFQQTYSWKQLRLL